MEPWPGAQAVVLAYATRDIVGPGQVSQFVQSFRRWCPSARVVLFMDKASEAETLPLARYLG